MTRTLITFGSGPGIGNHVASEFASKGFQHVILLSRNSHRLENEDAPFVAKAAPGVKVDTLALDLANLDAIPGVLKKIDDLTQGEDVEVVFFNAARVVQNSPLETSLEELEADFRMTNLSLYLIAQHFIPRLVSLKSSTPSSSPALLVTSSHLPFHPEPSLFTLSFVKAAQRNMVHSFHLQFKGAGVHCGLVSVEGVVAPEKRALNPKNIAEKTVGFWEAGVEGGVDVRVRENEE